MKNSVAYDKFVGGVTLTFFPINIVMLPFLIVIVGLKSPRASDTFLKVQYVVMMLIYCTLAMTFVGPVIPILYMKVIINAFYILFNNT